MGLMDYMRFYASAEETPNLRDPGEKSFVNVPEGLYAEIIKTIRRKKVMSSAHCGQRV